MEEVSEPVQRVSFLWTYFQQENAHHWSKTVETKQIATVMAMFLADVSKLQTDDPEYKNIADLTYRVCLWLQGLFDSWDCNDLRQLLSHFHQELTTDLFYNLIRLDDPDFLTAVTQLLGKIVNCTDSYGGPFLQSVKLSKVLLSSCFPADNQTNKMVDIHVRNHYPHLLDQIEAVCHVLGTFSNSPEWKDLNSNHAIKSVIQLCKSPESKINSLCLMILSNFTLTSKFQLELAAHLDWLVPIMYSAELNIRFDACLVVFSIALAAGPWNNIQEKMESCGAFVAGKAFLDKASSELFLGLYDFHPDDLHCYCQMLESPFPEVQATGALSIGVIALSGSKFLFTENPVHTKLSKITKTTKSDTVKRLGTKTLEYMGFSAPDAEHKALTEQNIQEGGCSDSNSVVEKICNPRGWTEDEVVKWIQTTRFAQYDNLFKDSWVDGDILIRLEDQNLADMGIANSVHRLYIQREIARLFQRPFPGHQGSNTSGTPGGKDEQLSPRRVPSSIFFEEPVHTYDVFISYRRATASQFSQLLKVYLRRAGYSVFLDVDGLQEGKFDQGLIRSLSQSKNVVLLLTPGALDRCKISHPECDADWVRKEIAESLRGNKNIVPVNTPDFSFPSEKELPHDIKDVIRINSVEWSHTYQDASFERLERFLQGANRVS